MVDDDPLVIEAYRMMLAMTEDFEICAKHTMVEKRSAPTPSTSPISR